MNKILTYLVNVIRQKSEKNNKINSFAESLAKGGYSSDSYNRLIKVMNNVRELMNSDTALIPYYQFAIHWYGARRSAKDIYIIIDKYGVPKISPQCLSIGEGRSNEEKDKILSSLMTYDEVIKYANIGILITKEREGKIAEIKTQNEKIASILGCNMASSYSIEKMR